MTAIRFFFLVLTGLSVFYNYSMETQEAVVKRVCLYKPPQALYVGQEIPSLYNLCLQRFPHIVRYEYEEKTEKPIAYGKELSGLVQIIPDDVCYDFLAKHNFGPVSSVFNAHCDILGISQDNTQLIVDKMKLIQNDWDWPFYPGTERMGEIEVKRLKNGEYESCGTVKAPTLDENCLHTASKDCSLNLLNVGSLNVHESFDIDIQADENSVKTMTLTDRLTRNVLFQTTVDLKIQHAQISDDNKTLVTLGKSTVAVYNFLPIMIACQINSNRMKQEQLHGVGS